MSIFNYSIVNRVSKYMYRTKCVGAVLFSLNSELRRPRSDCMALQADPRLRSSRICINLQSMTDKTELNIVIGISKVSARDLSNQSKAAKH